VGKRSVTAREPPPDNNAAHALNATGISPDRDTIRIVINPPRRAADMDPRTAMLSPTPIPLPAVARWVAARLGTIEHEQRVCRIAATLFDLSRNAHGLGPAARQLLRAAALLHDVGRAIDKDDHPATGARMIARDRSLPLRESDRRALAFLTLYHRDEVPAPGDEALLQVTDDRPTLRKLLALLRASDALDSRSLESPRLVFGASGNHIGIACYLSQASPKAQRVYERRKKFRLIEEEMGVTIEVDVRAATTLRMVA
jgi:exopolyphosphatase/pppGpp-phosphohydrolase